jgi:hypothetical protein
MSARSLRLDVYTTTCAAKNCGVDIEDGRVADLERQVETLGVALEHRTTIGQALGIIMERLDLDRAQAWAYLSRCSQDQNEKAYDLAARVVETRELPDSPSRQGA